MSRIVKLSALVGVIWGSLSLAFVFIVMRDRPPDVLKTLLNHERPFSLTLDLFSVDFLAAIIVPALIPYAVGLDLLIWTIGLLLWLVGYGPWPGAALSNALNPYPALAEVVVIFFTLLGGMAITELPVFLYRLSKNRDLE